MEVFRDFRDLDIYVKACKEKHQKIGFVPTMGALHLGHLSLCKSAKKENDIIVSSIFVNPTQFNDVSDLEKYPRNEENDLNILLKEGIDAVYLPKVGDIYPDGLKSNHYDFEGLDSEMEGKSRPGHFLGVATVVEKLFRQVQPDNAYFGEKDFQQLTIIKKLVEKLKLSIRIKPVPIYREENLLAMSSRNAFLTAGERNDAKIIYETLLEVKKLVKTKKVKEIIEIVDNIFSKSFFSLEYFAICNEKTLKTTTVLHEDNKYRAFIAVSCRNIRLIDNISLSC